MAHIPKAICMNLDAHEPNDQGEKYGQEMFPAKNDFRVEMVFPNSSYYKIHTDLYECPQCGNQTVVGFAKQPFTEHWQPEYDQAKADVKARFRD